MKRLRICLDVVVPDEVDPEQLGESVFEFFTADSDNLFPEIDEVETYDVTVLP